MKYLLLLAFLIPLQSLAQVELVRPADFRYHVTVDGDTVSTRSMDYKAHEDAVNYRCDYPDAEIIIHPTGVEVRGECKESPADTAYVNLPPHDNSFLHSVDWTHEVDRETGDEKISFVIQTENVDTLVTEIRCGNEWVKERVFPDEETAKPANTLYYGILWDCDSDLIYQFRAHKGVWQQAITERFPAFAFELTESEQAWVDSLKKKNMAYLKITNDSLLWTNSGHDNAVFLLDHPSVPASFWNDVSANGGNLRVYYWDGSQEIAVAREVVDVDTLNETGAIFFDSSDSQASTANEWRVYAEAGATEPASTDPLGSEAVWGNGEIAVYHKEGETVVKDSSPNKLDGTWGGNLPTNTPAVLGDGQEYNGNGDHADLGKPPELALNPTDTYTISTWVRRIDGTGGGVVIGKGDNATSSWHYRIFVRGTGEISGNIGDGATGQFDSGIFLSSGLWEHIGVRVVGGDFQVIHNGQIISLNEPVGNTPTLDRRVLIGARGDNDNPDTAEGFYFVGDIDEVRFTGTALSDDYLETEYNNQSDPTAFWTVELVEDGVVIDGESGAYNLTGQNADVQKGNLIESLSGNYSFQGQGSDVIFGSVQSLESGNYALSGSDATVTLTGNILFNSGAYSLQGRQADILLETAGVFEIPAEAGAFALSGNNADIISAFIQDLQTGQYALSGNDADVQAQYQASAETGEYILSGQQVDILSEYIASLGAGSISLNGQPANVTFIVPGTATQITTSVTPLYNIKLSTKTLYIIETSTTPKLN